MTYGEAMYGETMYAGDALDDTYAWVEMAGAIGDTVVYGPAFLTDSGGNQITQPGENATPFAAELVARSDMATVLSTLDGTFERSFLDEFNDVGSGTFAYQIAYGPEDLEALIAIDADLMVNFYVYGVLAFTMLIESRHRITWTDGEDHDQIATVIGRGHLAVTDESVLYPSRGPGVLPIEEDRTFNWSTPSPVYDDSGWGYSFQICTVAVAQTVWPHQPFADGWPSATTGVIWAPGSTTTYALGGTCYFRKDITLGAAGWYLLYAACDNEGELWLDGQAVIQVGTFTQSFTYSVYMTAGDHTFAMRGQNYHASPPFVEGGVGQGPAGFIFALYTEDAAGEPDTLIVESDNTWKIVAYPANPPGMFVGKVLHVTHDEATARSELTDITLMFTETLDSAGAPWPETVDIATKVGTSWLTFLIELTASYIDVWMQPGTLNLYAWNRGTKGIHSAVTLHAPTDPADPTSGNMYEQAHTELI